MASAVPEFETSSSGSRQTTAKVADDSEDIFMGLSFPKVPTRPLLPTVAPTVTNSQANSSVTNSHSSYAIGENSRTTQNSKTQTAIEMQPLLEQSRQLQSLQSTRNTSETFPAVTVEATANSAKVETTTSGKTRDLSALYTTEVQ